MGTQSLAAAGSGFVQIFSRRASEMGFSLDPAQQRAAESLSALAAALSEGASGGGWLPWNRRRAPARGLYLWGGVGRGKSFLMDTFFEHVAFSPKRRVHFHRFMQEIHARLRKLLEGLLAREVTIVTTSNTPPERLYLHGLQRSQFLPAIELIGRRLDVMHMDDGTDYRQAALERAGTYHVQSGREADAAMAAMFRTLAGTDGTPQVVLIEGRPVSARAVADGVAWFDFEALCDGPRAQADYIELARRHHTVFLSGVPRFKAAGEADRMRRFTWMVDEFYDRRVKLIVSAAADAIALYSDVNLTAEQERTSSRLVEMQTHRYLGEPHLG